MDTFGEYSENWWVLKSFDYGLNIYIIYIIYTIIYAQLSCVKYKKINKRDLWKWNNHDILFSSEANYINDNEFAINACDNYLIDLTQVMLTQNWW